MASDYTSCPVCPSAHSCNALAALCLDCCFVGHLLIPLSCILALISLYTMCIGIR